MKQKERGRRKERGKRGGRGNGSKMIDGDRWRRKGEVESVGSEMRSEEHL